ncbi:unnamed protein product [Effrenium voratum]|uniref:Uncharacterized protein n=1 Tax=Effrenium voratum TaxID=2562239 RepID=A0AA36IKZ2_9DINO|nr:unnamed protein product [Effrenium voratum]
MENSVFLGAGASYEAGLDWLGEPEESGEQLPMVAASACGPGRGLFTNGRPRAVEVLRDRSIGADGFLEDEEAEQLDSPVSDFLTCVLFGGKFGWLRDEFTSDGALRPLRDTLQLWLEEGRCAQHIEWDENQKCYTLAEPLKSYVAWNDPSNLGAMPNDALFDTCGNQAEYNIKDAEVNNLVMVPCARATENGLVEFKSMWLYPRKGWCWDEPQELTLGYGWEEPDSPM